MASAAGTSAQPQAVQPATQTLEPITITGSNVRRTDQEPVAPVEVITREQIERSGAQSVAEVLQKLPATGSGAFNELPDSDASGSTSVSLRSLGQRATLVLVNGRRTAVYGFAQSLQDSFVDLSAIPKSAVERIEVLKDGASAIYGSDAIAGVVNIILRNDFQGLEAAADVGFFEGKNDYRVSLTAGFGDPRSGGFNVFGLLDYYKRDGLTMADTEFAPTRDLRERQGGRNFGTTVGGGTWIGFPFFRAHAECPNVYDYAGAGVGLGLITVNQANYPPGVLLNQPGNTFCVRDYPDLITVTQESERIGFTGGATADFGPDARGYTEVAMGRNKTAYVGGPPGLPTVRFVPAPAPINFTNSLFNALFAPGAAGNPLAVNALYVGGINSLGPGRAEVISDSLRLLVGLKVSRGDWKIDGAVSYSSSDASEQRRVLFTDGTLAALGIPDVPQPPTPIVARAPYELNRPSSNSAALSASMFGWNERTGKSELKYFDTRATTRAGELPGGPVGVALGVEYRGESIRDTPSARMMSGGVMGSGLTIVDATRTIVSMFGELALPITREIEGQAAVRYDHYSDFGTAVTPKLGVKYRPAPQWLLRTNWGRGFRAPSLPEITRASSFFTAGIIDPVTGRPWFPPASLNANPDLKPEESRNFTAGLVFEPTASFSAGIDFYGIDWSNMITKENFQTIVNDPNDARVVRDAVTGQPIFIAGSYVNLGQVSTRGVDLDLRAQASTAYGRIEVRAAATYVASYKIDGIELAGTNGAHVVSDVTAVPRWKARGTVAWEKGAGVLEAAVNYIHHYWRTYGLVNAESFFRPNTPFEFPQTGQLSPKSPSYTTFDLYARYNVTQKLAVSASVINLTDVLPPFDPSITTAWFTDITIYDIRGRIFRLEARYSF